MALVSAALGWGMFFVAVVFSSLYSGTRKMQGYEWIPGLFIVPLAWLGFVRWPATSIGQGALYSSADERAVNETAVGIRVCYIVLMVMTGIIMGGIFVTVGWFIPPETVVASHNQQDVRHLHTSPSPTPAPSEPAPADPVTGTMLLAHLAFLVGTVIFQYLAVTTPSPTEHDDLPMDQL